MQDTNDSIVCILRVKNDQVKFYDLWYLIHLQYFQTHDKEESIDQLFQFLSRTSIEGLFPQNSRKLLVVVVDIHQVIRTFIYIDIGWVGLRDELRPLGRPT